MAQPETGSTDIAQTVTEVMDQVIGLATSYGMSVVGAVIILIVGWVGSKWAQAAVLRALRKVKALDDMLRGFFASMVRYTVLIVTVLAVLDRFGVETTSLIAVLGAAGLAIGLALQGTLSSVAAGVMLLIFRPFKIGDYIEGSGLAGTVQKLTLFTTELSTADNVYVVAPNSQLWNTAIKNYSRNTTRRVDMVVGIAYSDDINKAMDAILATCGADKRVQADPAPFVAVSDLGDNSVNLVIRVWCATADYWGVKFDLTKTVKERLDHEGISIPFPQRDVHIINENPL